MPIVALPDGKRISVPEGTSPEQILEFAQSQIKSVSERAQENLNPKGEKAIANEQKIQAVGQMQKEDVVKGVAPLVAAAPFLAIPAGLTGLAALAAGAGAGLTGGLAANEFKRAVGSKETLHGAALLNSLGVDTALGTLGAGVGLAANATTTGLLPRVIESSANNSARGAKVLDDLWFGTRDKLFTLIRNSPLEDPPIVKGAGTALVKAARRPQSLESALLTGTVEPAAAQAAQEVGGGVFVPVGRELEKAFSTLKNLPKGVDALGEGLATGTSRGNEILDMIHKTLVVNKGSVAMQPLAGLVRIRSSLNTAVRNGNLSGEEVKVFGDLSDDLNRIIQEQMKRIGPEAQALYNRSNELGALKDKRVAAVNVANKTIFQMFNAHKIGTAIGGALGFKAGGWPGSVAGAGIGAAFTEYVPKASAWALKVALEHPKAASMVKAAIQFATVGKSKAADSMMARAFGVAGVRTALKDWLTEQSSAGVGQLSQAIGTVAQSGQPEQPAPAQ